MRCLVWLLEHVASVMCPIRADIQGAYAEYIVSPESMLLPKPKEVGWDEAGGIPENWMTGV